MAAVWQTQCILQTTFEIVQQTLENANRAYIQFQNASKNPYFAPMKKIPTYFAPQTNLSSTNVRPMNRIHFSAPSNRAPTNYDLPKRAPTQYLEPPKQASTKYYEAPKQAPTQYVAPKTVSADVTAQRSVPTQFKPVHVPEFVDLTLSSDGEIQTKKSSDRYQHERLEANQNPRQNFNPSQYENSKENRESQPDTKPTLIPYLPNISNQANNKTPRTVTTNYPGTVASIWHAGPIEPNTKRSIFERLGFKTKESNTKSLPDIQTRSTVTKPMQPELAKKQTDTVDFVEQNVGIFGKICISFPVRNTNYTHFRAFF